MMFSSPPALPSHVLFLIFFPIFFPPLRILLTFHYYLYSLFPSQIRTPPQYSHFFILHSYKPLLTLRSLPPNSVIVRTSESYDFLCSYLFVLLENPRVSFISFVALTLSLCKEKVAISLLLLFALQGIGCEFGMFVKF